MLDLNEMRAEFAAHLAQDPTRFRMDAALAHVITLAYQRGIEDGSGQVHPIPLDITLSHSTP